ncbi:MAG: peptide chain release factor N(5)-glutamine methyltransferase [Pseudomonadota bacterium]
MAEGITTVKQALQAAAAAGLDRLDARLLLLHVLGRPLADRAWLVAHDTDALQDPVMQRFTGLCGRRAGGEPLAYLTGSKEFYGLDLQVDARVLVPRPDTETLVDWALSAITSIPRARVLDLGTGSGAIALAIKHARPDAEVSAVDASAGALEVARANASRLGLEVDFLHGSWLSCVSNHYHIIVSNPPYIASGDHHLAALGHEPIEALAAGPDGLADIRQIASGAAAHLLPGGWLMLEHGYDQAEQVRELLGTAGLEGAVSRRDLAGIERCSGAKKPGRG